MPLKRPVAGDPVVVEDFGQPVYDYIVANQPTAWVNMTYLNSWRTYPGYQALQYRKIGDIVYLRGFVQSPGTATAMATLPSGFWPPMTLEFASAYYSGSRIVIAVSVSNNGNIAASDAAPNNSGIGITFQFATS